MFSLYCLFPSNYLQSLARWIISKLPIWGRVQITEHEEEIREQILVPSTTTGQNLGKKVFYICSPITPTSVPLFQSLWLNPTLLSMFGRQYFTKREAHSLSSWFHPVAAAGKSAIRTQLPNMKNKAAKTKTHLDAGSVTCSVPFPVQGLSQESLLEDLENSRGMPGVKQEVCALPHAVRARLPEKRKVKVFGADRAGS